ncbi:MAG TPA: glycoside hydrolase family 15 protein [Thermomicrobiales bacterium]|nr:glycoside hydrolase family 15 protein [Thermomicrobiales bacterium]
MPRDIPVANGRLLVTFDSRYRLRDVYFPHIGQENHTDGSPCTFGVWTQDIDNPAERRFAWVHDDSWTRSLRYRDASLVTDVQLTNAQLGISLACSDAVDIDLDAYLRAVVVHNDSPVAKRVRLFFHFDARLWGNVSGDTAFLDPDYRALVHYKGKRYLWLSGCSESAAGLSSWAIGNKYIATSEGTWRDAEDGVLGENPVAQGSIDTVAALDVTVAPGDDATVWFWLAAGFRFDDVRRLHEEIVERSPAMLIERTDRYWSFWSRKQSSQLSSVPKAVADLYQQSLLILRTQIDDGGAILAANDSDIFQFGRDTYSYMWPRDGALVSIALDTAGYSSLARQFYVFASELITRHGFFLHKYNPDGSAGSSWHPWATPSGELQFPIQEDETALVLYGLDIHLRTTLDTELVRRLYDDFIAPATRFLLDYRDPVTGLPQPSYDLWEERRGVMAFTVGSVWAGLHAGARFADLFADETLARDCRAAAGQMRDAVGTYLYDASLGRFLRRIVTDAGGSVIERDPTLDSSLVGLSMFGMLAADDPRVVATMEQVERGLWVQTDIGGIARYTNDYYHQLTSDTITVPGNPWIICTLWLADWYIAKSASPADLERAMELIEWVVARALPSGTLPEQVHPYSGQPLSVSPLTWSHATFIQTVRNFIKRQDQFDRSGWETFLTV